MFDITSGASC